MCRFLLVKSKIPIKPSALLTQFAKMAKTSKAPDGDWQGDGWGISWVDSNNKWQLKKSLLPIWEDTQYFSKFPKTTIFVVHARSASFPAHKGVIEFNQPYISDSYAFVFNGLLKGVSLPGVPGEIGAEKIWYLLERELRKSNEREALKKIKALLLNNSKEIIALNIGLVSIKKIYTLNYFIKYQNYYNLYHHQKNGLEIICSEPLT